jgi:hypothetical protein
MFQFIPAFFATVGAKAATVGITKAAIGQTVLSAAASAIMNKSADNRPQTTTTTSKSRTNFQEMRDDAIAAGYNPLTALRMTGGAGNVTTTGTSVINTPALSSRAILGRAIGAGLNSLGNSISSYDPLIEKQKQLNIELSKKQLNHKDQSFDERVPFMRDGKLLTDRYGQTIYQAPEGTEAVPMYINVYDQNTGQMFPIINPELTEAGPTEIAAGMGMIAASKTATEAGTSVDIGPISFSSDPLGFNRGISISGWGNSIFVTPKLRFQ